MCALSSASASPYLADLLSESTAERCFYSYRTKIDAKMGTLIGEFAHCLARQPRHFWLIYHQKAPPRTRIRASVSDQHRLRAHAGTQSLPVHHRCPCCCCHTCTARRAPLAALGLTRGRERRSARVLVLASRSLCVLHAAHAQLSARCMPHRCCAHCCVLLFSNQNPGSYPKIILHGVWSFLRKARIVTQCSGITLGVAPKRAWRGKSHASLIATRLNHD